MTKTFAPRVGACEGTLEDGRVLVPGEQYELTDEQQKNEHNARLIESRQIVEVKAKAKTATKKEGDGQ